MTFFWIAVGLYALAHGSPGWTFFCACGWLITSGSSQAEDRE